MSSSRLNRLPRAMNSDRSPTLRQQLHMTYKVCAFFCRPFHVLFSLGIIGLSSLCARYNVVFDAHVGVLVTLTLFPITFTLGGMLEIRNLSLVAVTTMKGNLKALYLPLERIRMKSDRTSPSFISSQRALLDLENICRHCKEYVATLSEDTRLELDESIRGYLYTVHAVVDSICTHGCDPFASQRLNIYCLTLVQSYENFKGRIDYRVSILMRKYLSFMAYINMVLLTPWFGLLLQTVHGPQIFAYIVILTTTTGFLGLLTILSELEDVFGQDWDDLNIDALFPPLDRDTCVHPPGQYTVDDIL